MVTFNLEPGRKLTDFELEALQNAKNCPIVYDDDSPALTPEMEKAFIAARRAKPFNSEAVTLYLSPETVAKAKNFGSDYIATLGRILDRAMAEYKVS